MKVDFINSSYRRYYQAHKAQMMKALDRCFSKGDFILREDVARLKKIWRIFAESNMRRASTPAPMRLKSLTRRWDAVRETR